MKEELKISTPEEIAAKMKEIFDAEAEEKKKDPGQLVTLPKSKLVVRLRRKNIDDDTLTALPLSLVAAAAGQSDGTGTETTQDTEPSPEQIKENAIGLIYFRETVTDNCIEPRVGRDSAGRVSFLAVDTGKVIARVHPDDFLFMFEWITGQEGNDGLKNFRNRKERRASASQSRSKGLRPRPVGSANGQSAAA